MDQLFLFVGEGNFSFSTSLALSPSFPSLNSDLVATDYIPELKEKLEEVEVTDEDNEKDKNLKNKLTPLLKENVSNLKSHGHRVLFDVDATKLHEHQEVCQYVQNYSRILIIFNFPHAKSKKMKIGLNRDLLRNFFISCDKLFHYCLNNAHEDCQDPVELSPIVSLCAGQSGIPEVDSVHRGWGDSWQINDMAAHGNFVCSSVCEFNEWNLVTNISSSVSKEDACSYQSSYYRLQSSTGFQTKDALTLTYKHSPHLNPHKTDRLKSLSILECATGNETPEVVSSFIQVFSPIRNERFIPKFSNPEQFQSLLGVDEWSHRPYFHTVTCTSNDTGKILRYLNNSICKAKGKHQQMFDEVETDKDGDKILVKSNENVKIVGKLVRQPEQLEQSMTLYVDRLIELKYKCDYRLAMSPLNHERGISLYPHTHEFHISFWISVKFTMDKFIGVLLDVYGMMLKSLEFLEKYEDRKVEEGSPKRVSYCWRIQVESLDMPLSRLTAHQMYLELRTELEKRLGVDVR